MPLKDGSNGRYDNYGFPMLEDVEVIFFDMIRPEENVKGTHYEGGPKPGKTILRKGHVKPGEGMHGCRPLPCDMHYERDMILTMRDGANIYVDIFRPVTEEKVPAILAWSPYGKTGTGEMTYDRTGPYNYGIDPKSLSGYHKFEASDPAEWAERGYAIINVDARLITLTLNPARGAFDSDGHMMRWGPQEALDVYDTIEYIVQQPWCNGAVGMSGNSWLAVSQINAAARCPHPALKCIAPWEGHSDHYNDVMVRGGIPQVAFGNWMQKTLVGRNKMEDTAGMARSRTLFDKYWQIKAIPVENIDIPTYIVASHSSFIHTAGSLRTWRKAKTPKKWIRFHNAQEWADLYKRPNEDDLQRFFDRYLKDIDNDWETSTPPVRLTMISFHGRDNDVKERPEQEYPLARQQLKTLYLDTRSKTMSEALITTQADAGYAGHHLTDCLDFTWKVEKYTEIAGYPMVKLWMSCKDHDDMDVRVQLRKMAADGKTLLEHRNYHAEDGGARILNDLDTDGIYSYEDVNIHKFLGSTGMLRASHAVAYNETLSTENEPHYDHDRSVPIAPGTIVPLQIGFWPTGMTLDAGESLMLRIAGHSLVLPEFKVMVPDRPIDFNKGIHQVHTGGQYDSQLILPIINA